MNAYDWFRLKWNKSWIWRLLHPKQGARINAWLRDVEIALKQEMERTNFNDKIDQIITDGLSYGTVQILEGLPPDKLSAIAAFRPDAWDDIIEKVLPRRTKERS